MRAPARAAPYTETRNHRWLRARIATPSPPLTPIASRPLATRVGGIVEFFERELAVVVDDGSAIGGAAGVQCRDHPELTPAPDIGEERGDVLRRLQPQRAGLEHFAGVVQFGRSALGVLLNFGRCLQRKIS